MWRTLTALILVCSQLALAGAARASSVYCTATLTPCPTKVSEGCGDGREDCCPKHSEGESEAPCCVAVSEDAGGAPLPSATKLPDPVVGAAMELTAASWGIEAGFAVPACLREWPDPPVLAGRDLLVRVNRFLV